MLDSQRLCTYLHVSWARAAVQSELTTAVESDGTVKVWDMADMAFQATAHIMGTSDRYACTLACTFVCMRVSVCTCSRACLKCSVFVNATFYTLRACYVGFLIWPSGNEAEHDPLSRLATLTGNFPAAAKWITRVQLPPTLKEEVSRYSR